VSFYLVQALTGLASAASLFLVAAGLSIIFGVTRIVNFAHGSFYMLGAYVAYSLVSRLGGGALGFWVGVVGAALAVGAFGAVVEMTILRRIYRSPELFQLLATFGVVLVVEDAALAIWGPEDLLGPQAPGLAGAVDILGTRLPTYDLVLIAVGPAVLGALWLLFRRTRFGILVRAATEDREMVAALGVNQRVLFTAVFFLGSALAGLGGAMQLPREPVSLLMDLNIIAEAFVVVVVGGMGSVAGAFLAAVLIAELNAFGILVFPQITIVLAFLVMAVVLVVRPWGLMGRPEGPPATPSGAALAAPLAPAGPRTRLAFAALLAALLAALFVVGDFTLVLLTEMAIFALFAASLHMIMGPGGMVSFGHAAYFGLGAYGAALAVHHLGAPMGAALAAAPVLAGAGALLFGWFCVRLTGVYLAMLTLAFAQIAWSVVFEWYDVTGGDNGILGVWPAAWASDKAAFYYLVLALCAAGVFALRAAIFAPFGYGLRAVRDSPLRAAAIGIRRHRQQWLGFAFAGVFAGLAGGLFAFSKGSVFPDAMAIPRSVDALVMVLMGGVQTVSGPLVGAVTLVGLEDEITRRTELWRAVVGGIVLLLVLAFPQGIVGFLEARLRRRRR